MLQHRGQPLQRPRQVVLPGPGLLDTPLGQLLEVHQVHPRDIELDREGARPLTAHALVHRPHQDGDAGAFQMRALLRVLLDVGLLEPADHVLSQLRGQPLHHPIRVQLVSHVHGLLALLLQHFVHLHLLDGHLLRAWELGDAGLLGQLGLNRTLESGLFPRRHLLGQDDDDLLPVPQHIPHELVPGQGGLLGIHDTEDVGLNPALPEVLAYFQQEVLHRRLGVHHNQKPPLDILPQQHHHIEAQLGRDVVRTHTVRVTPRGQPPPACRYLVRMEGGSDI
mmetsp:Transcript_72467/g.193214  ORF Transcript_72467/g.193214 Transcript_72467/m.193214 type:complete len:279 (-) Transcript_72467:8-844(-)